MHHIAFPSGETMPVVKEAHVELTMGQRTLRSWVFVADIKDDFILGLDILRANDASVDIGRRVLRLGQDEVPVREAPTPSELKRARPTENRRNWRPGCWQCGRTGHLCRGHISFFNTYHNGFLSSSFKQLYLCIH
jgi:hypothetical protein